MRASLTRPCLVLQIESAELLHPLTGIDLGRKDVALPVDGDVVQRRELTDLSSGSAKAAERLLRGAIDNANLAVHAVDHVDQLLLFIGREYEVVDRTGAARCSLEDVLGDEAAVLAKEREAVVAAIADVDKAVRAATDAMHRVAELL